MEMTEQSELSKNVFFHAAKNRFRAFFYNRRTKKSINASLSVKKFGFDGARERAGEWSMEQGKNNLIGSCIKLYASLFEFV